MVRNLIITRLKVVCASEGGRNAKEFCKMHNYTSKEKFPESFSITNQAI